MGREDELPALLLLAHARDDALGDAAVVEVVLGLVNDEGRVGLEQEEQEHGRRLLAGRKLLERVPVGRLPRRRGVEPDRRGRRQIEFRDAHQDVGRSLGEPIGLCWRDPVRLAQGVGSRAARLHELGERQVLNTSERLDGLGEAAPDVIAQRTKERLAIAGCRHLDLDPVA
jgi:hypothetical protein